MDSLKILDLYNETEEEKVDMFNKKTSSFLSVKIDKDSTEYNTEWLEIMEDTVKYIDNILRNPNRFIVNEEDVIKIELARRVTVESIKHLSKNTNLIQEYDKQTGDVRPSKILNINKEESYDTYENRLIYTLIQNMKSYISRKKKNLDITFTNKNDKKLEYNANCELGNEKIDFSISLNTKLKDNGKKEEFKEELEKRIEVLEQEINALTYNDVYKTIEKKHISLITPPIKKTNLVMKNVNFQYAIKLWDYLQNHMDDEIKKDKFEKTYENEEKTKKYIDETFLINYLAISTLDNDEPREIKEEITSKLASTMVKKMIDLNESMTEEELKDMISKQYATIKYKNVVGSKSIENKFKEYIDKYLDKIKNTKL